MDLKTRLWLIFDRVVAGLIVAFLYLLMQRFL